KTSDDSQQLSTNQRTFAQAFTGCRQDGFIAELVQFPEGLSHSCDSFIQRCERLLLGRNDRLKLANPLRSFEGSPRLGLVPWSYDGLVIGALGICAQLDRPRST